MTFATPDKALLSRFHRIPHSRAALALAYVASDSLTWGLFESRKPFVMLDTDPEYFKTLLDDTDAKNAWDKYTNTKDPNEFPQKLAKGTASLNGFRHYWIQDCIYLQEYVRVRLEAIVKSGDSVDPNELRNFTKTATLGLDYAAQFVDDCVQKLGVPMDAIKNEWQNRSQQLKNSIEFYTKVANGIVENPALPGTARPWVDIHFALLPCIKGYYQIATNLLKEDATIVKNTLFYTTWISGNSDGSFAQAYDDFLTTAVDRIKPTDADWERWRKIFTKACGLEQDFLTLATQNYNSYGILPADKATYTISPYGDQTKYLDVKDNKVTLTSTATKWTFTNGTDGYTIQNATVSTQEYLTFANTPGGTASPYYTVEVSSTSKEWPINPISVHESQSAYQLFALEKLQFVLDYNKDSSEVFVANNYQGTSQTWILTKV